MESNTEKLLRAVEASPVPIDPTRLMEQTGIQNWATASRRCLELALQGRIRAIYTTHGWVFCKLESPKERTQPEART